MISPVRLWREHFLVAEAGASAVPAVGVAIWFAFFGGESCIEDFIDGNRANIYRTTATIAGTLLGFSIAVASLVLSFASSERLAVLRRSKHYPALWKTFFQAIRLLGALTVTALVCLIWDKENAPLTWLVIPLLLFASLAAVRLLRVIWILEQIVTIVGKPSPSRRPLAETDGGREM